MAALSLKPLDQALSKRGFYIRFMDDWAIMVKTKRQLRAVVTLTYRILNQLKLKMHPDKTFIGRTSTGFDFLGVHFGRTASISQTSQANHPTKLARRYAQGTGPAGIGIYIDRWTSWCNGLLKRCNEVYLKPSMDLDAILQFDLMGGYQERKNEYNYKNYAY